MPQRMKYKPKQYARALMRVKKLDISIFLALLKKNGDIKKLKEILIASEKLLLEKSGNKKVVVETARKTSAGKQFVEKGDILEEKINPDLIAGVKITINGEQQLDFSMKKILNNIF